MTPRDHDTRFELPRREKDHGIVDEARTHEQPDRGIDTLVVRSDFHWGELDRPGIVGEDVVDDAVAAR